MLVLVASSSAVADDHVTESASAAAATPYAVGDRMTPLTLEDQHGKSLAIDAETAILLFSRDMDGGQLLKTALEGVGQGTLDAHHAVYVSDISEMPKMVARLFAVPSMRRRAYSMALDRSGAETARLPDVEGQATLIFLDRLRVARIEHVSSAGDVRRLLGLPVVEGRSP